MKERYSDIRKKAGMTSQEAATKLGVSISTFSCWETGKTSPDAVWVIKMCDLYGCTADELLGIKELKGDAK